MFNKFVCLCKGHVWRKWISYIRTVSVKTVVIPYVRIQRNCPRCGAVEDCNLDDGNRISEKVEEAISDHKEKFGI